MDYEIMMNGNVKLGQIAPEIEAETTLGKIRLSEYQNKWIVLFSYPGDFERISTNEIIIFSKLYMNFKKCNTEVIGISTDSILSHINWLNSVYKTTGIKIQFPIISDKNGEIARKYGMISNEINNSETTRNVYIIDNTGRIRAILSYPNEIDRSINEILSILNKLQAQENHHLSNLSQFRT